LFSTWTDSLIFCVLELSRLLVSMRSSRAVSRVMWLYWTDVSRTISVIIVRGMITSNPWRWYPRWFSKRQFNTDTWHGSQPENTSSKLDFILPEKSETWSVVCPVAEICVLRD
jgi:hypothetical protein